MPANSDRRSLTWFVGVMLGVLDGFVGFEFPLLGLLLVSLAGLLLWRRSATTAGVGGLLIGAGGIWAVVLANAEISCGAFNAVPTQQCGMDYPDVTGIVVAAAVVAVVGLGLSLGSRRSSR